MMAVVAGVPGVGKTSILKKLSEAVSIPVINFGDIMYQMASNEGLVSSRDDIRQLSIASQKQLQIKAAKDLHGMSHVIIDTNCTVMTPVGFLMGIPNKIATMLEPDHVIIIEADPVDILIRRTDDTTRNHNDDSLEDVGRHMEANRMAAFTMAAFTGATVSTINNNQGELDAAVEDILGVLEVEE